jgi:DUF4097 and DUF4098 domain-containing protein YvlB
MVGLSLVVPAAAQVREGSFERTLTTSGAVDLTVVSGSGSIRVVPGAAGSVRVSARLKSDAWFASGDVEARMKKIEANPPVEQRGGVIRIGEFADSELSRNISISYDLTVPADTSLTARTGSGSISIGALKGSASLNSGSGSIHADGAATLEAHTGSGSIEAAAIAGPATVKSGSGSVTIALTGPGDVSASAGSGSVRLTGVNGSARISTGSGSVHLDGRPAGPWSVHSGSGGITLTIPQDAGYELDARTSSGAITSTHEVTMVVSGRIDKHHIAGKVHGGGPRVEASCSSGSIVIH